MSGPRVVTPQRKAIRFARLMLGAATLVSLAGNVEHAAALLVGATLVPLAFALCWAAVPALTLPASVHLAGLVARAAGNSRSRKAVVAGVVGVALLAFIVSYSALRDLTLAMGYPPAVAYLFPLLVDLLASISTVALLVLDVGVAAPLATPATGGHVLAAPVADPAAQGSAVPGLHLVPGHGDRHPASTSHAAAGVDGTSMTSLDAHLGRAEELVAAGVVRAEPVTVAVALAGLADGGSHRAVAAATGLHRTSVSRLAASAEEAMTAG